METTNIVDFARRDGMSDARVIVKAMGKMELPNLYRQTQDQLHTASDGQKCMRCTDPTFHIVF